MRIDNGTIFLRPLSKTTHYGISYYWLHHLVYRPSRQPCPKCGGIRTRPAESDKAFYQRLWDMEETATFISHLWINWGSNDSPVDKGKQEFKCTQCVTTFSAIDIRPHPYSASLPSRCPHCQSIRTLPASEEKQARRYESIWLLMEFAEKERKESRTEKQYVDLKCMLGSFWPPFYGCFQLIRLFAYLYRLKQLPWRNERRKG